MVNFRRQFGSRSYTVPSGAQAELTLDGQALQAFITHLEQQSPGAIAGLSTAEICELYVKEAQKQGVLTTDLGYRLEVLTVKAIPHTTQYSIIIEAKRIVPRFTGFRGRSGPYHQYRPDDDFLGFKKPTEEEKKQPKMKFTPHLILTEDGILIKMPYHKAAKDSLKALIPIDQRKWVSDVKAWKVDKTEENLKALKDIIRQHFMIEAPVFTSEGNIGAALDVEIDTSNYYTILGLKPGATAQEIKKAHRAMIVKIHPDKGGLSDHFIMVQKAYEVLSNPDKKARYDMAMRMLKGHQDPTPRGRHY